MQAEREANEDEGEKVGRVVVVMKVPTAIFVKRTRVAGDA
jgi:hypothetical protein